MSKSDETRTRNPFRDPLVTELIESPLLYRQMFSPSILIGETVQVFQAHNVVLLGPQGSGKSMLLNLIRHRVIAEWIKDTGAPPAELAGIPPFFGISINLVRADFHAFGRRSVAKSRGEPGDTALDALAAADFLNHYLLREFLAGLLFAFKKEQHQLREWLQLRPGLTLDDLALQIANWDCWFGYYSRARSFRDIQSMCDQRLLTWRGFLNANLEKVPDEIWTTKSTLGAPQHEMGNLLGAISKSALPLFVVIDQYEVLPELNRTYGADLQRVVNTLIKARDPVVFYKIGARTHDWGKDLRIFGADSRIEVRRDYVQINLFDVLNRNEDSGGWLFPKFATDVVIRRADAKNYPLEASEVPQIFGDWTPEEESRLYFPGGSWEGRVLSDIPEDLRDPILRAAGPECSPLTLRLAAVWLLSQLSKEQPRERIVEAMHDRPWEAQWWKKDRIQAALYQIASLARQKKLYCGWKPITYLSGSNISAFLLLTGEIWDRAVKLGYPPVDNRPIAPQIQTEAIYQASEEWRSRDKNDSFGGSKRYEVLSRLGPAIRVAMKRDSTISRPGHTGFSLRESDLWSEDGESNEKRKVREFLLNAVSWAILEERPHTSKLKESVTRRKFFLHPLLAPAFQIPYIPVKEPMYVSIDQVYEWIFGSNQINFGGPRTSAPPALDENQPAQRSPQRTFGDFE